MDTLTALRTRRAVRKYTDDPVNPEDLETILDCGRYAPCGMNRQGWRFIVVTDPAVQEKIYEANKRFCILGEDYKRIEIPEELHPALHDPYRKKSFYVEHNDGLDPGISRPEYAQEIGEGLLLLKPLYQLLTNEYGDFAE